MFPSIFARVYIGQLTVGNLSFNASPVLRRLLLDRTGIYGADTLIDYKVGPANQFGSILKGVAAVEE